MVGGCSLLETVNPQLYSQIPQIRRLGLVQIDHLLLGKDVGLGAKLFHP